MAERTDMVITRMKHNHCHNLCSNIGDFVVADSSAFLCAGSSFTTTPINGQLQETNERNTPFIITLAMVKKPYLVDGGLIVKKNEYKMMPKKTNDRIDKEDKTILMVPVLIACHINDRSRRFVERNIRVKAR